MITTALDFHGAGAQGLARARSALEAKGCSCVAEGQRYALMVCRNGLALLVLEGDRLHVDLHGVFGSLDEEANEVISLFDWGRTYVRILER
ncbi:MAG: hypothetical protein ABWK00_00370 [Desulfurococcaceae archaeon]